MWFVKQVMKLIKLLLPRDLKIQQRERKAQFKSSRPELATNYIKCDLENGRSMLNYNHEL